MDWLHWIFWTLVILVFVFGFVLSFIWIERRGIGKLQVRRGPNRAGPFGLLQPIADAIKILTKEDIVPLAADRPVHWLAPIVTFLPALAIFAAIPFQEDAGLVPDLNIGILYVIALSSLSVAGVFMAGWGSNNKFSLVAAMRTIAQMVSYEIPLVLAVVGIALAAGSLSLNEIVKSQSVPFILLQPLGFLIYFTAALSELNRSPFDLMEAESEIIAGYHTEYSGMKFALFYLGEYAYALGISALASILFLGGWKGPLLPPWLWFLIKILFFFTVLVWIRGTLPRLRVDQLMGFAWKCLLPLALINVFLIGAEVLVSPELHPAFIIVNIVAAMVLILLWSRLFRTGGGRVAV